MEPGEYDSIETVPTGWYALDDAYEWGLAQSGDTLVFTFVNFELVTITAVKWHDLDHDGCWDEGEPEVYGWTMTLSGPADGIYSGAASQGSPATWVVKKGGDWTVTEADMYGWVHTTPTSVTFYGVQSGDGPLEAEFGNFQLGARTPGYWKTHPEAWADWVPDVDSVFYQYYDQATGVLDQAKLLTFFPKNTKELKAWNQVQQLRSHLLAAELNVYYFGEHFHYDLYLPGIFDTIADAEEVLQAAYDDAGGDNLAAWWKTLSKTEQNYWKGIVGPLKNALEMFNEIGDEAFEYWMP